MLCVACIVCLPRLNWASRFLRDLQLFLRRSQFFLRLTQFCQHVIQFFVEIAYLLFRHHGLSITERSNLNSINESSGDCHTYLAKYVWDDNIFNFQKSLSQGLWISEVRNVAVPHRNGWSIGDSMPHVCSASHCPWRLTVQYSKMGCVTRCVEGLHTTPGREARLSDHGSGQRIPAWPAATVPRLAFHSIPTPPASYPSLDQPRSRPAGTLANRWSASCRSPSTSGRTLQPSRVELSLGQQRCTFCFPFFFEIISKHVIEDTPPTFLLE